VRVRPPFHFRDPRSPDHAEWLCQIRVGIVEAFKEVTDLKVQWSLWECLDYLDRQLDKLAPNIHPATSVGKYLAVRDQHRPADIPNAPDEWTLP
jgi:hypothetical protein